MTPILLLMVWLGAQKPDTAAPRVVDMPAISLLGNPTGTDQDARRLEKNAPQLVSVTGSETMQRAADLSVTDAVQRMAGLSIIHGNSGEDSRAIIRGMSPKYNGTLVQGMVIPSPDERRHDIPLDLFPAGLTQRIEVYKSLTPDMEGGAIGGLINIVMKDAGAQPFFSAQVATGYSQLFFDRRFVTFDRGVVRYDPPPGYVSASDFTLANLSFRPVQAAPDLLGGLIFTHRYAHEKLGMVLAADYQGFHHGSDGYYIGTGTEPGLDNAPGLTDYYTRKYSTSTVRQSFYNQWDYRFNDRNKLTLFSFYTRNLDAESRMSVDTSLVEGRSEPGTGRIDIMERSRLHIQQIESNILTGAHRLSNAWSLHWAGSYAYASGRYPDWAELDASTGRLQGSGDSIVQSPVVLGSLERQWLISHERQEEGKAELTYSHGHLLLEAGGDFRHKNRDNTYTEYTFTPSLPGGMGQPFVDIYHAQWLGNAPQDPLGSGANPNTYRAHEDIGAAFLAARYTWRRFDGVGGLRRETTVQDITSDVDPTLSYGQHIHIRYADWLPSIQGRYRFAGGDQLRASWFEGLSRPALSDVTFASITQEDYVIAGNPFLIRTSADNLDLRYEHADTWQLGVFYKRLRNPFEKTLLNNRDTLYPLPSGGLPYTPAGVLTEQLRNYGSASNYGLEAGYTRAWGHFGLAAHYTFTLSRVTQTTKWKTRVNPKDPTSDIITVSRSETRPLEGQSKHLASLSLWYKDARWTAQVSSVYTGARIDDVSGWYGLDQWQRGYALLDVAAERHFGSHWSIFVKGSNVLNSATVVEVRQANTAPAGFVPGQTSSSRITVQRMQNGQRYLAGVRFLL